MLHSFLKANREALIERCRATAAARLQPARDEHESVHGIPLFIDQLIETLTIEQTAESGRSLSLSGPPGGGTSSEIGDSATLHGRELLKKGFTLDQVVRDYGDVCQAVTNLAYETQEPIAVEEFRTFNRCLDNAIAGAVTAFALQQSVGTVEQGFSAINSRLGPLVHELRNYLHVAMQAVRAIKAGNVGIAGATGAVLERSLIGMRNLIDSSLAEVRVTAGLPPQAQVIRLAGFINDIEAAASLDPRTWAVELKVMPVDAGIFVEADPEMLASAVGNLLQNALKFTQRHTVVTLHAHSAGNRVLIDVKDHCGGLPPSSADNLLRPFVQAGRDRTGLGLGLDICRRSVEANKGTLRVQNLPGTGCIFTIDLPRFTQA